jgi:murein L,D-transpeptidase YcbB/YkuD
MPSPTIAASLRSPPVRLAGLWLAALLVCWDGAAAQRQRVPPPEPSLVPSIGAHTVQGLQGAIAYYEKVVAAGGWPALPARVVLRPGDSDEAVALLRRRLQLSGDIGPGWSNEYAFDAGLEEAVKRYQRRHGLEPTGVVYGITYRSLNVPADVRLRQLQLNLARVQQLLARVAAAPRYIVMNAASFELQGIAGGRVEIASRTIAGKRTTPTPVVSATLQAINILPYWHVPATIAKAALVPTIRKDPGYLFREKIRVFSSFGGEEIDPRTVNWFGPEVERLVFRQDPGPQNALGVLRFDMPNKHIVYMHDTPAKKLFGYYERAYSAGCVRVQSFFDLAEWALAGQDGWTSARLQDVAEAGRGLTIRLARPVPVHFIYHTAWVEEGVVQFRNDLYNRDEGAFEGGEDFSARVLTREIAP